MRAGPQQKVDGCCSVCRVGFYCSLNKIVAVFDHFIDELAAAALEPCLQRGEIAVAYRADDRSGNVLRHHSCAAVKVQPEVVALATKAAQNLHCKTLYVNRQNPVGP